MNEIQSQIILTAINLEGARAKDEDLFAYQQRLMAQVVTLTALTSNGSVLSSAIEKIQEPGDSGVWLTGVLTSARYEENTTRYVMTFKTKVTDKNPEGVDEIRTMRTDGVYGLQVKSMIKDAKNKHCRFLKVIEDAGQNRKVRVCPCVIPLD
jgi:hypothetical protein